MMSNPFVWLYEAIASWLSRISDAITGFVTWFQAAWASIFNVDTWATWAASVFPLASPDVGLMFYQVRGIVDWMFPVLRIVALGLDLRAVALFLATFVVVETALVAVWLWRGALSITPFAG